MLPILNNMATMEIERKRQNKKKGETCDSDAKMKRTKTIPFSPMDKETKEEGTCKLDESSEVPNQENGEINETLLL